MFCLIKAPGVILIMTSCIKYIKSYMVVECLIKNTSPTLFRKFLCLNENKFLKRYNHGN